jgi:hypothetical protein
MRVELKTHRLPQTSAMPVFGLNRLRNVRPWSAKSEEKRGTAAFGRAMQICPLQNVTEVDVGQCRVLMGQTTEKPLCPLATPSSGHRQRSACLAKRWRTTETFTVDQSDVLKGSENMQDGEEARIRQSLALTEHPEDKGARFVYCRRVHRASLPSNDHSVDE